MKISKPKKVTIIGAGLAGCFMAINLAKKGYAVTLYEQFSYSDYSIQNSNRSFNLTFYRYGVDLIKKAGLWKDLKPVFRPLQAGVCHGQFTKPTYSKFDNDKHIYLVVERASLLKALYKIAKRMPQISIHFNRSLTSVDRRAKKMVLKNTVTGDYSTVPFDILIGADGVNSKIRPYMQTAQHMSHVQEYSDWTYKQIFIPQVYAEKINLAPQAAHIWPGKHNVVISFPNNNGSFTAMLLLPKKEGGFKNLQTLEAVQSYLTKYFPLLSPIAPHVYDCLTKNPEGSFVSIYTKPWYYQDMMVLIGDAAHGVLPFYGQGVSAAFDDCLTIIELLNTYNGDWEQVLPEYQKKRKRHTDVLADISKDNFNRLMRDKKADYIAVYDKLDDTLHSLFPRLWLPSLPRMVITDTRPFADMLDSHNKQRRLASYFGVSFAVTCFTMIYTGAQMIINILNTPISLPESKRKYFNPLIHKLQFQNMLS